MWITERGNNMTLLLFTLVMLFSVCVVAQVVNYLEATGSIGNGRHGAKSSRTRIRSPGSVFWMDSVFPLSCWIIAPLVPQLGMVTQAKRRTHQISLPLSRKGRLPRDWIHSVARFSSGFSIALSNFNLGGGSARTASVFGG